MNTVSHHLSFNLNTILCSKVGSVAHKILMTRCNVYICKNPHYLHFQYRTRMMERQPEPILQLAEEHSDNWVLLCCLEFHKKDTVG